MRWQGDGLELEARSARPEWTAAPTRQIRFELDPVSGFKGGLPIMTRRIASRRQFIASFRDGVPSVFTPDDAMRVLEVLDAIHESSRTGRRVNPGQGGGQG